MKQKIHNYFLLTRQDKPVGTLLVLGSTSWGLMVAANGHHDWKIILIFLLGAWLMRSAGCIINDYADRDFDRHVERTKNRPLTTGEVSTKEALGLFAVLSLTAFSLTFLLNIYVTLTAIVAILLASIYPYMKRFTWWPQVFLGLAFSWSIPMAFVAYQETIPMPGWAMFVLSTLWIIAYDTIYAMVDSADDIKIGIKSTAIYHGENTQLFIACLHLLFICGWIAAGYFHQASIGYWGALILAVICFGYQHYLIVKGKRTDDTQSYFKAFKINHWIGWIILGGLYLWV